MDRFSIYAPRLLPKDEKFLSGRRSCKGCGKALAARLASKAIGDTSIVPESLFNERSSFSSQSYSHDDLSAEDTINKFMSFIDAVNETGAKDSTSHHKKIEKAVIGVNRQVFMSDFLLLGRVLQTGKEALFLCFDNEPYMDTLIQRTVPKPLVLAEKPHPVTDEDIRRIVNGKNIPEGIGENDFSYIATACVSHPFDFMTKVKKALSCSGNAFISVLTPCPTGWIFPPAQTLKVGMKAVQTGYFPLYEIENG